MSNLKKGICCVAASATLVAAMTAGFYFGWKLCLKGNIEKAHAFDNYRIEELEKAKDKLENGEITQAQFDVRVSEINGTQNMTVFRNIWVEEGHENCCEAIYKESLKQTAWGVTSAVTGVLCAVGATITGMVAKEEFRDR